MDDLTIKEVCQKLKISRETYYKLDRAGSFPNKYKLGNWSVRIPVTDLDALKKKKTG